MRADQPGRSVGVPGLRTGRRRGFPGESEVLRRGRDEALEMQLLRQDQPDRDDAVSGVRESQEDGGGPVNPAIGGWAG